VSSGPDRRTGTVRRTPRGTCLLGLWTAGWLAVVLLIGLAWVGTWSLQWWVLLVPALWAAVVLVRGRGRREG
jgi:hypothetical protein